MSRLKYNLIAVPLFALFIAIGKEMKLNEIVVLVVGFLIYKISGDFLVKPTKEQER